MTGPRSYAPQRTVPEAIEELRRCAGTQFDPAIVDVFAKLDVEMVWPPQRSTVAVGSGSNFDP